MAELKFNTDKVKDIESFIKLCPFGAIEYKNGELHPNAACKMCKLCIKKGPEGAAYIVEHEKEAVDKSLWQGICVYAEQVRGKVHPVAYELIGKARELVKVTNQKVYCLMIGHNCDASANDLLRYGVDEVFVYDDICLEHFNIEPYTAVFENYINNNKPSAILVGATPVGRQLAPRVAARFRTGLTADCTVLQMDENTDLKQIRPAFGGNIMAQIHTQNNRPQMATVRYKIFEKAKPLEKITGKITHCSLDGINLKSRINVISVDDKPPVKSIENAEIIVAVGRGFKKVEDIEMAKTLAKKLGAEIACTRPLVENGTFDAKCQIGLSGRTVRPKLIITLGISGAVQFAAGMNNSDYIIAVNSDPKASIFKIAHCGIVGDIYKIVPQLIERLG